MSKISLRLLLHCPSDNTKTLRKALIAGSRYGFEQSGEPNLESLLAPELLCSTPLESHSAFALGASGMIIFTPENFGYMSGALKDWFDRSYYELENTTRGLPYAICVRAGKDGTGSVRSIQSIAKGLGWKQVLEPHIVKGSITEECLDKTNEFAATFAAGLCLGVY